jgi:hypothetical protein
VLHSLIGRRTAALILYILAGGLVLLGALFIIRGLFPIAGPDGMGLLIGPLVIGAGMIGLFAGWAVWQGRQSGRVVGLLASAVLAWLASSSAFSAFGADRSAMYDAPEGGPPGKAAATVAALQSAPAPAPDFMNAGVPLLVALACLVVILLLTLAWNRPGGFRNW